MQKFIEFVKERPFQGAFLVLCAAALIFVVSFLVWNNLYHALKVKDIHDPRFDPMAYRFEDYAVEAESQKVLTYIFPVGTPREKVEDLLVKKLGAKPHHDKGIQVMGGGYWMNYKIEYNPLLCEGPPWIMVAAWPLYVGGRYISVVYDANNKLVKLQSMVP